MDFNLLLENWGNLGATGVISLFFGFMITESNQKPECTI